jgi:hypothetical protein
MSKLLAILGVLVGVAPWIAQAAPPSDATWVLLGIDVHMGAVTVRDSAADADTVSVYGEGLPVYQTAAGCQVALRHAVQKYTGRSHAEGNFGSFLCTDYRTWAHGR